MKLQKNLTILLAISTLLPALCLIAVNPARAEKDDSRGRQRLAGKTVEYEPKEGFERRALDLINTLKNNEVGGFATLLDGLSQAYDLDNTLKGKGPITLFAPIDKAFERIPQADRDLLWANKKKLKQVLSYHIVLGKLTAQDLKDGARLKTLEGHSLTVSRKGNDIYLDKALVKVTNIPCSNGELHVLDDVVMPPLSQ
ncbi:MAG: fasciclin domain-containing protein [Candidatus Melainabacteria bacterium]|nr:fasciclin domain-containing protein [Candidatus Melainabacteria bacterium]